MLAWFKKKAQNEEKMDQSKYKDEGTKEKLLINPKPGAFDVSPKIQQPDAKIDMDKHRSAADKTVNPDSAEYKDQGTKEKLLFPTGETKMPAVKQPGLAAGEDAGSKTYKDPGKVEKLETPKGETKMPVVPINVSTEKGGDANISKGEKGKLITSPKSYTVPTSQPKSDVGTEDYRHKYDKAKPFQKQFSQIEWFKRAAVEEPVDAPVEVVSEDVDDMIAEIITENPEMSVVTARALLQTRFSKAAKKSIQATEILIAFAQECPESFQHLVAHAAKHIKADTDQMEASEYHALLAKSKKGETTPEDEQRISELAKKANADYKLEEMLPSDEELDKILAESEELLDLGALQEVHAPIDLDVEPQPKDIQKALSAFWEAAGKSQVRCAKALEDSVFLKTAAGESREIAAQRTAIWFSNNF